MWSDTFMRRMAAFLAGEKGRPRAMPQTRVGLRGWLEPVDPVARVYNKLYKTTAGHMRSQGRA